MCTSTDVTVTLLPQLLLFQQKKISLVSDTLTAATCRLCSSNTFNILDQYLTEHVFATIFDHIPIIEIFFFLLLVLFLFIVRSSQLVSIIWLLSREFCEYGQVYKIIKIWREISFVTWYERRVSFLNCNRKLRMTYRKCILQEF